MQLLPRVIGLWRGRLLWTIHIRWRGLRTAVWKALSYFVENCSVTAKLHPERRKQFRSMSHLVSENKSIYFLTCFAQMKITLFIFVNKWVIWENESFLLVELCSHVPKSRGDGEVSCFFVSFFFFWDWQTIILDYLRYIHPLPYLTSIFRVALKVHLTHHCMR